MQNEDVKPTVNWQSPLSIPVVQKGDSDVFWLATRIRRGNDWAVVVFDAQYVNNPLEYADSDIEKEEPLGEPFYTEDGEPIDAVGWHSVMEHVDFNGYYEPIVFDENRELLGWGLYLKPEFTLSK